MPRLPKANKLGTNTSVKLDAADSQVIDRIVSQEGIDKSKVLRSLLKEGIEGRETKLKRGGRLGLVLLERFRQLDERRQFDLIALADALLDRQRHDNSPPDTRIPDTGESSDPASSDPPKSQASVRRELTKRS